MKNWIKYIRLVLFVGIIAFAIFKCGDLYSRIKVYEFKAQPFLFIVLFVFISFAVQALLTKTIVSFCDKKIKLSSALGINVMGGLMGILLPFGSVAYKAIHLKNKYNIDISAYSSFYGLSFLCSLVASVLSILIVSLFASKVSVSIWCIFAIVVFIICFLSINWFGEKFPFLKDKNVLRSVFNDERKKYSVYFIAIHLLSLVNYILIYKACLSFLDINISFLMLGLLVAIQNIMFLAPIVPGNFGFLEYAAIIVLGSNDIHDLDIALAVLLMRFVMLASLVFLASIRMSFNFIYKEKALS